MKKHSSLLFSVKDRRNYTKNDLFFCLKSRPFCWYLACIGVIRSELFCHSAYEDLPHSSSNMLPVYKLQKNLNVRHLYRLRCSERSPSKQLLIVLSSI